MQSSTVDAFLPDYYVMLIRGVDGEGAFDELGRAEVEGKEKQLFSCVS